MRMLSAGRAPRWETGVQYASHLGQQEERGCVGAPGTSLWLHLAFSSHEHARPPSKPRKQNEASFPQLWLEDNGSARVRRFACQPSLHWSSLHLYPRAGLGAFFLLSCEWDWFKSYPNGRGERIIGSGRMHHPGGWHVPLEVTNVGWKGSQCSCPWWSLPVTHTVFLPFTQTAGAGRAQLPSSPGNSIN